MMRVLVVEKSRVERRAMVDALANIDRVAVIGAVSDEDRALAVLEETTPEIIVAGVEAEGTRGLEFIERARARTPAPKIVVVGQSQTQEQWRRYLAAGADRIVERDGELDELQNVIETLVQACAEDEDVLRLLGRLAVGVAHDLNGYLGATRALLALSRSSADDRELLREAHDSLEPALRLTASLVEYVRGNTLAFEPLDLGELVRRVTAIAGRAIRAGVTLSVEAPAQAPVRGAVTELEQLVLNLALNAADASPSGSTVQLRVVPATDGVMLEVIDHGPGFIGAHVVGDALGTTTKPGRRAGLGLGIVHRVVQRHGGTFRISSNAQGTVASVFLPTRAVTAARTTPTAS